jgi:hypothetical protein
LVQGYTEGWNGGILKRAVEVNRKELKEHKDKGMWFIPLGFRLTRRVIAWLSAWVEKNSIFYAFFAFFAVKQLPNSRQFDLDSSDALLDCGYDLRRDARGMAGVVDADSHRTVPAKREGMSFSRWA